MKKIISTLLLSAVMLMAFTGLSLAQTGAFTTSSQTDGGGSGGGTTPVPDDQPDPNAESNIPT